MRVLQSIGQLPDDTRPRSRLTTIKRRTRQSNDYDTNVLKAGGVHGFAGNPGDP